MKKLISLFMILSVILALSAGLFACKNKETPSETRDKNGLAAETVIAAFSETREDGAEIADALLSLLARAGLEDPEIITALPALTEKGTEIGDALLDVKNGTYVIDHIGSYFAALQAVASGTSPEIAGRVYYTAASAGEEALPYSQSDCEKLASLFLGQDAAFADLTDQLLGGNVDGLNVRQVNTIMITLVASLRKAVGLSESAKNYLATVAENWIDSLQGDPSFSAETMTLIEQNKAIFKTITSALLDGYDDILAFLADYLAVADARLFLGLPYEKEVRTVYYGYRYSDWSRTEITREQYDARNGGYDEYLAIESTFKGFTVNGAFLPLSESDVLLADNAYRLYTAYKAYSSMTEQRKTTFLQTLSALLTAIAADQETVATLLGRDPIEPTDTPGATFDELLTALSALASFDATDGITEGERTSAERAIATFERYLHGYLPKVY